MKVLKNFSFALLLSLSSLPLAFAETDRIEELIKQLGEYDIRQLTEAVDGMLTDIGPPVVDILLIELEDGNSTYRSGIIRALGRMKDPRAIEPLVSLIQDPLEKIDVRLEAISALGYLDGSKAAPALIKILKDRDQFMRAEAARALGMLGDQEAVIPLIEALGDEAAAVRYTAVPALGLIRDVSAIDPLITLLADNPPPYFRDSIFEALWQIGSRRHLEQPLIELLEHRNFNIRLNAAELLRKLEWRPENLSQWVAYSIAEQDWDACVKVGSPAVKQITFFLDDTDNEIRERVAHTLREIGDPSAIPALVRALPDWYAGGAIARALRELGWKPESVEDKVHLVASERDIETLKESWDESKNVLMNDLYSKSFKTILGALRPLIEAGGETTVNELRELLSSNGTTMLACAFFQTDEESLEESAWEWLEITDFEEKWSVCGTAQEEGR